MTRYTGRALRVGGLATMLLGFVNAGHAAVGRTPGFPGVTPGGEAAYSIPLRLPAGTGGLTPALSLEYRQRSSGGSGGIGWQVGGLSRIHRCPRTVAQDGEAGPVRQLQSDRFCLDGVRLVVVNGQVYGTAAAEYRTEIETYSRIRTLGTAGTGPQQFTVETADGRILEYGATADSRIDVGGAWISGSATARVWALNRVRDRSGNAIDFSYVEDGERGSYRVTSVDYTGNPAAGVAPAYRVSFVYENRPGTDADFVSEGGVVVSDVLRLARIEVLHLGAVVRRYELDYQPTLSAAGRSRLAALRECGQDGGDCLAATTFAWQDGTPGLGAERAIAMTTGGSSNLADRFRWWSGDVNGDGRDDLVWTGGTVQAPTLRYRLARAAGGFGPETDTGIAVPGGAGVPIDYDGDGFQDALFRSAHARWQVVPGRADGFGAPIDTGIPARGIDWRAADLDGNGLPDLVYSEIEGNGGNGLVVRVLYNQPGAGFVVTPVTLYEQAFHTGYEYPEGGDFLGAPGQRVDLDGDGRDDVLMNETYSIARISADQSVSESFVSSIRRGTPADLNGDGCTDFAYPHYTGNWRVRISDCRVSGQPKELAGPSAAGLAGAAVAIDWDGDGRDDLLYRDASASWRLVRSTGSSLLPSVSTGLAHGSPAGVRIADVDGNGLEDLVTRVGSELRYREHSGAVPDLLRTARDGFGVLAAFEYSPLTRAGLHARGGTAAYPDRDLQDARQVVARLELSDGTGGDATIALSYAYQGLRRNGTGRGDLGFARRIVRRDAPSPGLRETETYRQDFPFTGLPAGTTLERANGRRIRQSSVEWKSLTLGSGPALRHFPHPARSTIRSYAVGGTIDGAEVSRVATAIDGIDPLSGLVTDLSVTTSESAGGLHPGASHSRRQRHTAVFNDTSAWCLGRPRTTEVVRSHALPGGEPLTTTSSLTWEGAACRPLQAQTEPDSSAWRVTVDFGYDRFGNLGQRTVTGAGMSPRSELIDWGADGRRPLRLTNPLSQSTTIDWHPASGLPAAVVDPNGLRTSWSYDAFARLAGETRPDGTRTIVERAACASDCGPRASYRLSLHEQDDAGSTFRSTRLEFDRFERTSSAAIQLPGGGYGETSTEFDVLGRVSRHSLPRWAGAPEQGHWQYHYDDADRVIAATLRDATGLVRRSNSVAYDGLSYVVTDPRGHATRRTFTAWADPLQVVDPLGGTARYRHDAAGRLTQATDARGNVVSSVTYNARGMKVVQQDVDLGTWSFAYDALGELVARTDAQGNTASFSYDPLGRLIGRTEPEGTTTWTWGDSATSRNIDRLAAVAGPGYSETYRYDAHGRLATRIIRAGSTYRFSYAYNALGLPGSLTYPVSTAGDRFRVSYGYSNGYLSRIADAAAADAPLWQLGAVDAAGRVLDETLGADLRVVTGHDPVTGQIDLRQAGAGASLQDLAYDWDEAGKLTARRDLRQGLHEQFVHDALGRLDLSRLNGVVNLDLSYDAIGNLTWKSDVCSGTAPCYSYDPARKHAVVAAGSHRYAYDANGNMTSRDGAALSWTSYSLPSSISAPGGNYSRFWYGPDRGRFKQVARNAGVTETTIYAGGLFEKATRSGVTTWKHYVESPTGVVALYLRDSTGSPPRLRYLLHDHLGSTDQIVDAAGPTADVAESFDAFGKRRGSRWSGAPSAADLAVIGASTRRGFTGQEQLDHLGLIHMNGRVYDPLIARFTSADPAIHEPFNGQDLNRYAYAWNSPLNVADPSGREEVDCLRAPGGPCQGVTVIGLRDTPGASLMQWSGRSGGQVASAAERDPCGQDGSAAACNGLLARGAREVAGSRPAGGWSALGSASLNAIPGWYYSGQAASALQRGDLLSAALFYGASAGDVFLLGRGSAAILASRYAQAELAVTRAASYGPTLPGPLAPEIASTFRSASYRARVLDEPLTVYRVIGDTGRAEGRYWTTLEPRGALQSVIDLAIDQNWRNPAIRVIRAEIPAGTSIYEGITAPQRGLVGGAVQIYIPRVDPGWLR